jgi:hypothetical protein
MSARSEWYEANRHYLAARLAMLRESLRRSVGEGPKSRVATVRNVDKARISLPAPAALDRLATVLDLSVPETEVVLLCVGIEIDADIRRLALAAADSAQPTFAFLQAVVPELSWESLTPLGALRYWRVLEVDPGPTLMRSPVRLDERVLHFIKGVAYLDERLQGSFEHVPPPTGLPRSHAAIAARVAEFWRRTADASTWPLIQLSGPDAADKRAVAANAADIAGLQLHLVRAADIPTDAQERSAFGRLWEREALLSDSALLIESAGPSAHAEAFIERQPGLVLVGVPSRFRCGGRRSASRSSARTQPSRRRCGARRWGRRPPASTVHSMISAPS